MKIEEIIIGSVTELTDHIYSLTESARDSFVKNEYTSYEGILHQLDKIQSNHANSLGMGKVFFMEASPWKYEEGTDIPQIKITLSSVYVRIK
jgi:hypothetical protein